MPKMTPDRDDSRGQMAGEGGPQRNQIGRDAGNEEQEGDVIETGGMGQGELGQGMQRHPGGSSRDSEKLGK